MAQNVINSKMQVLILNSEFPPIGGGAGNASAHIAAALHDEGHQVTVLTSAYGKLPHDESIKGVRIIRLPALRRYKDRSTAFEQLLFMLVLQIWGFFWLLKLRPDSILAFFGAPSGIAAWSWNILKRTPYIVLLRGGDVPGFRPYDFGTLHRLMAPILRLVWRAADAVVANSQGLKALGAAFEPRVPILVIPNGVSPMALDNDREWSPPRMLFVGRLVYQKGLDLLFNALANLKELDWQLSIVGDGPRKEWLEDRATELKLSERIQFLGWQSRDQLRSSYADANLFVYPSRHEGMPNALLEAMSAGLPSVASDIAGNEELIDDGKNGFLVEPENVSALEEALDRLMQDQALRKKMGAAAQKKTRKEFTWKSVGKAYSDLLQEKRKA